MKKIIYKIINWYATHFRFPARGSSILFTGFRLLGINDWYFFKKLPSGIVLRLNINDHIQKQLFWHGAYEFGEMNLLIKLLEKGDCFMDIGANIGYFSLHAAHAVGQTGMVWSFEPATAIFEQLEQHIKINKFSNINAVKKGVSNKNLNGVLYLSSDKNYGSTGLQPGDEFSGETEDISLIKLDDFVIEQNIKTIRAVKIDVEGHELQVLQGMLQILNTYKPAVLIEIIAAQLQLHNNTVEEIYNLMNALDYTAWYIDANKKLVQAPDIHFEGYGIFFLQQNHLSKIFVHQKT